MSIKINGLDLQKRIINGQEVEKVMYNGQQIRPSVVPPTEDYLCFTANTINSTIQLNKSNAGPSPNLKISYDRINWIDYSFTVFDGMVINLPNIGDKVYFMNSSETPTSFSGNTRFYRFTMTGGIDARGDVTTLLCKYGTDTLPNSRCFAHLFQNCTVLRTAPRLEAITLTEGCYEYMFENCTSLVDISLISLPATILPDYAYLRMFKDCTSLLNAPHISAITIGRSGCNQMFKNCISLNEIPAIYATSIGDYGCRSIFSGCVNIKISKKQIGDYQNSYRIPMTGTGSSSLESLWYAFENTGGTYTSDPRVNGTYYTSNTVI